MTDHEKRQDVTTMQGKNGPELVTAGTKKMIMSTRKITSLALLSALAAILMFLEITIPVVVPPFLKLDLSEIPVLIGAFAFGPISAIMIELIKNLIHLPLTTSGGVGEIANFLAGSIFAGTAGIIYQYLKNKKGAIIAVVSGTIAMTVFLSFLNYYFLLPFYAKLFSLPIEVLVGMGTQTNYLVTDLKTMIMYAFVPFNLFKGVVVSIITIFVYKYISPILHGRKTVRKTNVENPSV